MVDDDARRREIEQSERLRRHALEVARNAERVDEKVQRMNRIYRERLTGVREGGVG